MAQLTIHHGIAHAKGADRSTVKCGRLLSRVCGGQRPVGVLHTRPSNLLVSKGEEHEHDRGKDCEHAQPEMQKKAHKDEYGCPWRIQESRGRGCADRLPHRVEVAHGLHAHRWLVARHDPPEDLRRKDPVEADAGPCEQSLPNGVQRRKRKQRHSERDRNVKQGHLAAGGEHAVIDLKHVNGRCEEQQVEQEAEPDSRYEMRAAGPECVSERGRKSDTCNFHLVTSAARQRLMKLVFAIAFDPVTPNGSGSLLFDRRCRQRPHPKAGPNRQLSYVVPAEVARRMKDPAATALRSTSR